MNTQIAKEAILLNKDLGQLEIEGISSPQMAIIYGVN